MARPALRGVVTGPAAVYRRRSFILVLKSNAPKEAPNRRYNPRQLRFPSPSQHRAHSGSQAATRRKLLLPVILVLFFVWRVNFHYALPLLFGRQQEQTWVRASARKKAFGSRLRQAKCSACPTYRWVKSSLRPSQHLYLYCAAILSLLPFSLYSVLVFNRSDLCSRFPSPQKL